MQKLVPTPHMICKPLNYPRRSSPLKLLDKIPVKLKKLNRTNQPPLNLSKTLRPPNQPAQSLTQNAVKILNIRRLNIAHTWNAKDNHSFLTHQTTMLLNLHKLTIINQPKRKTAWQNIRVIVIPIREQLKCALPRGLLGRLGEFAHELHAGFLSPLAHRESHEQV